MQQLGMMDDGCWRGNANLHVVPSELTSPGDAAGAPLVASSRVLPGLQAESPASSVEPSAPLEDFAATPRAVNLCISGTTSPSRRRYSGHYGA